MLGEHYVNAIISWYLICVSLGEDRVISRENEGFSSVVRSRCYETSMSQV